MKKLFLTCVLREVKFYDNLSKHKYKILPYIPSLNSIAARRIILSLALLAGVTFFGLMLWLVKSFCQTK